MKLYHISREDLGDIVTLNPKIPINRCSRENNTIPRVCCAASIYDCLISSEASANVTEKDPLNLFVYCTEVDASDIYIPVEEDVPDAFYTNEIWLMDSYTFIKECNATLRMHMNIPNSPYSRYAFTKNGCEEVIDRIASMPVYGTSDSFSYIDLNANRIPEAIKYAEQHREEYEC